MEERTADMARNRLTGRSRGANRLYRVAPLSTALAANGLATAGVPIRFRKSGVVIAMFGQVYSGLDIDLAGCEVRIQIAGTRDLFTDGDSGVYAPFLALFGKNQNWWPLDIPAREGQDFVVSYRNMGTNSVVPSLMFAVLEAGE